MGQIVKVMGSFFLNRNVSMNIWRVMRENLLLSGNGSTNATAILCTAVAGRDKNVTCHYSFPGYPAASWVFPGALVISCHWMTNPEPKNEVGFLHNHT